MTDPERGPTPEALTELERAAAEYEKAWMAAAAAKPVLTAAKQSLANAMRVAHRRQYPLPETGELVELQPKEPEKKLDRTRFAQELALAVGDTFTKKDPVSGEQVEVGAIEMYPGAPVWALIIPDTSLPGRDSWRAKGVETSSMFDVEEKLGYNLKHRKQPGKGT